MQKIFEKVGGESVDGSMRVDAIFVESDFLRRYLTGFYSTDGYVILDGEHCKFVADLRYYEAAEKALAETPVELIEGGLGNALELLKPYKRIGVPFPFLTAESLNRLTSRGFEVVDVTEAFRTAMLIKTDEEISLIQRACDIAEDAFLALLPDLKEGMAEREVAALLEYRMRCWGAEGPSFETIVAFGENGSIPHYATGDRKLRFGDPVLIDFGCKAEGYCSDMTRTFLFGDDGEHEEFKKIHAQVLMAHELVKTQVKAGMTGKTADAVARGYLRGKGLAEYFTHSLGHGIGLQIHEYPLLSPRSTDVLTDGMVFSDEPGVYIAGKLGIRIEDSCYMKDGRVVSFMKKTSRRCIIL